MSVTAATQDEIPQSIVRPPLYRRLVIHYRRVISPREDGSWPDGHLPEDVKYSVKESISIVHPDDTRPKADLFPSHKWNAFRELGAMFKGNRDFFWVEYSEQEAVL